jgi:hypothetical protein
VTCVASGLLDHVNEDPANVDRSAAERRDRRNVTERIAPLDRRAASLASRGVEPDDPVDGVTGREPHRVVGVVGTGHVPWCGHLRTEQPALKPAVLGPREVPDDARDGQIRRGQQARRGLLPPKVDERCRRDRPVLIEALRECCALVFGLEIGVLSRGAHHPPILAAFGRRQRRRCLSCAKLESCDDGAMTDRMAVTDWVARYERAWRSPGTDALDELFTHGVVTPSPWAQPIDGLEAIRRFWDAGRSGPDERFRAQREIVAIDAPVAVVRVAVDYDDGAAVA